MRCTGAISFVKTSSVEEKVRPVERVVIWALAIDIGFITADLPLAIDLIPYGVGGLEIP
jgi:hypothetical protein